ncbi:MAG TPA: hydroxysqualene dehydroxylase HpnE [Stellaceae bacterium]|nr:hydroxysqualene dehydroxylase HpnE [Stellaceae bacterium]
MSRVHVVGAGLAGLAAALRLAETGVAVSLYEAGPQAGGRCRSYFDATLGCRIDNGNHLMIAGNTAVMSYLRTIGATDSLIGPAQTSYPFLDLKTGERWTLRPNRGRIPWWLWSKSRRVPGTRARDYLRGLRLRRAPREATVTQVLDPRGPLYRRFWQPMAVAALNTEAQLGSASLLGHLLGESFGRGGAACRPLVPRVGLSESLVDPALARLQTLGAPVRFGSRLRAISEDGTRVTVLDFDDETVELDVADRVVLAVTAPVAGRLLPGLTVPDAFRAILNAHYRVAAPPDAPLFVGLVGGTAEWVFRKQEVLSVTVSAADQLMDRSAEELAPLLWQDVARAYALPAEPMPPWQIVKERRATFAATPAQLARRPATETHWRNLVLAGDWTDTGLPATIEGAIRSGFAAAAAVQRPPAQNT